MSSVHYIRYRSSHSLALKNDGTVVTWGYNSDGQLGDSSTTSRTTPVQVANLNGVTALSDGDAHSMALLSRRYGTKLGTKQLWTTRRRDYDEKNCTSSS